ncbi:oxidoreductase [Micromonospora chokoriensis]
MSRQAWTIEDVPDQRGRSVIVTGASSGIGRQIARWFAHLGADVVLACRSKARAVQAQNVMSGSVSTAPLDLADLDSVEAFASNYAAKYGRLDVLVNCAGVMWTPLLRTMQGFELQFGTNHLGHFALTGRLLPLLMASAAARITTVTSLAQAQGHIDFNDLNWHHRRYSRTGAYGQSKLANMMFVRELASRLSVAGSNVTATAAHPGWTATNLTRHSPAVLRWANPVLGMPVGIGALSTMRAATDSAAQSGSYWGPSNLLGVRGRPGPARIPRAAIEKSAAERLWAESERLTKVNYLW